MTVVKVPGGLLVAAILQWVAAVVGVLSGLTLVVAGISLSGSDAEADIHSTLVEQGIGDINGSTISAGIVLAGLLLILIALMRVVVSVFLLRGRAWARIVLALIVLLSLVGGIAYLFNEEIIRGLLTIAIEAVVLYLLFNARSSAYIRRSSAAEQVAPDA